MRAQLSGPVGLVLGVAFSAACVVLELLTHLVPNPTEQYWIHFSGLALISGAAGYWFGSLHQRMKRLAMTDALTGVPNRHSFFPVAEQQLALAKRHGHPVSICLLDLDGFKQYNDQNGHLAGDELLCRIAANLRQGSRDCDVVARYGGDEFVLLMPMTAAREAGEVVRRLQREASVPPVTFSCGVATFPVDGTTLDDLLRRADERMYEEKARHHAASADKARRLAPTLDCGLNP